MSEKNDGGPAFPRDERYLGHNGTTLRDYFAGQALTGLTANANLIEHLNAGDGPLSEKAFLASIARGAYLYADAMLEARNG